MDQRLRQGAHRRGSALGVALEAVPQGAPAEAGLVIGARAEVVPPPPRGCQAPRPVAAPCQSVNSTGARANKQRTCPRPVGGPQVLASDQRIPRAGTMTAQATGT